MCLSKSQKGPVLRTMINLVDPGGKKIRKILKIKILKLRLGVLSVRVSTISPQSVLLGKRGWLKKKSYKPL